MAQLSEQNVVTICRQVRNTFLDFREIDPLALKSQAAGRPHSVDSGIANAEAVTAVRIMPRVSLGATPPIVSGKKKDSDSDLDVAEQQSEDTQYVTDDEDASSFGDSASPGPASRFKSFTEEELEPPYRTPMVSPSSAGLACVLEPPYWSPMTSPSVDSWSQDNMGFGAEPLGREAISSPVCWHAENEVVTTVMIRNISCRYTQEQVAAILDQAGFAGKYDCVYLPRSPQRSSNLGYAFLNCRHAEYVEDLKRMFDGKRFGTCLSTKLCQISPAHQQGLDTLADSRKRRKGSRKQRRAMPLVVDGKEQQKDQTQQALRQLLGIGMGVAATS